jgi:hypothetical protein
MGRGFGFLLKVADWRNCREESGLLEKSLVFARVGFLKTHVSKSKILNEV